MIRPLLRYGAPVLHQPADRVGDITSDISRLITDMIETMYAAHGIGLAAIQVGEPLRLLVIDLQEDDPDAEPEECRSHGGETHYHQPVKNDPRVFVNPEILDPAEELVTYQEGCLSVPEIYADIDRPARCRVRWQDLDGAVHEEEMEGLMATCIQHEIDHLNGVLFIDHLSKLKRDRIVKKFTKAAKRDAA